MGITLIEKMTDNIIVIDIIIISIIIIKVKTGIITTIKVDKSTTVNHLTRNKNKPYKFLPQQFWKTVTGRIRVRSCAYLTAWRMTPRTKSCLNKIVIATTRKIIRNLSKFTINNWTICQRRGRPVQLL